MTGVWYRGKNLDDPHGFLLDRQHVVFQIEILYPYFRVRVLQEHPVSSLNVWR